MKRFAAIFIVLLLGVSFPLSAYSQAPTKLCIQTSGSNCIEIDKGNPLPVTGGTTGGGATQYHLLSQASTNSTSVVAGAKTLYDITVVNSNAATAYLKFYDKATAPTCNTDTVLTTVALIQNIPVSISSSVGKAFTLGIGLCITANAADNDNTNATTGITVSLGYK